MEIIFGVVMFMLIVLVLLGFILVVCLKLVNVGDVVIEINNEVDKQICILVGDKLLNMLFSNGIFVFFVCGGGGFCGQCWVIVKEGGGDILLIEFLYIIKWDVKVGCCLVCQVVVKQNMKIELLEEIFGVKKWECEVIFNDNKVIFIKEFKLWILEGEVVLFCVGGYIQIECLLYKVVYVDFDVFDEYCLDWDKFNLFCYVFEVKELILCVYLMVNYLEEKGIIMFNVCIVMLLLKVLDVLLGIMLFYIWLLKLGDKVMIFGLFGEFFVKEIDVEMVFIGGGVGMVLMCLYIFDQFKCLYSMCKISFWYGVCLLCEMFYDEEFEQLVCDNLNFIFYVVFFDLLLEDNWIGYIGFIYNVLYENYLCDYLVLEDCEFYMCGLLVMNVVVIKMFKDLGVEDENIFFDDFGG